MSQGASEESAGSWNDAIFFDDCDKALHHLYHYLDGELTDDRREEIARHLDLCRPCADAAGFEADLRRVIANRCKDHVPETLIQRVATIIHEEEKHHGNGGKGIA